MEAICRSNAIEHGLNQHKSAMYVIERSVWRLFEPGGIVADPCIALWGMLDHSKPELVDGWMDERTREWCLCVSQQSSIVAYRR